MSIKVVYITGCLGFIGSYVTKSCLDKGWFVKGVDKMTYASNADMLTVFKKYDNFSFIKSDINDLRFLYDCDYVINIAAETHVGNSITNSDDFIHSNITGVHNILELIRNYKQEKNIKPVFFHFSTDEVYGDIKSGFHYETDLLTPSNPYSATKAAADMLILAWGRTYDVPYIIIRPTNNYGIGQYIEKMIPKMIKYLKLGRKLPLHNSGTPIRVWLHAQDTANAVIKIIESGIKNEIFNISGNYEDTNINVCRKIIKIYNGEENIDQYTDLGFSRIGQDIRYSINDEKIKNIGWLPTVQFDEELKNIVEYYRNKFIW